MPNDLEAYFRANTGRLIHKWHHYFEVYDRHFSRYRGSDVHVLEIGVSQGGSLQMWKDYFGPRATIYGVDIDERCRALEEERVHVFIGDQGDRAFLRRLRERVPRVDVLIDDGGHTMEQQIATFEGLFDHVSANGVYLCEDTHTSYWEPYGGGFRKRSTFIEYSKQFIDWLHAWHAPDPERLPISTFTRTAHSVHYYDSIVVVEKRPMEPPAHSATGTPSIPIFEGPPPQRPGWLRRLRGRRG